MNVLCKECFLAFEKFFEWSHTDKINTDKICSEAVAQDRSKYTGYCFLLFFKNMNFCYKESHISKMNVTLTL